MSLEVIAWGILGGVVFFQQLLIGQLTSKLMARSFGDYVTGERALKLKPVERVSEAKEEFDDYAASQAEKANRIFRA